MYVSQLSGAKNYNDLSSSKPILQHFEYVKVKNQLKGLALWSHTVEKNTFIKYLLNGQRNS